MLINHLEKIEKKEKLKKKLIHQKFALEINDAFIVIPPLENSIRQLVFKGKHYIKKYNNILQVKYS